MTTPTHNLIEGDAYEILRGEAAIVDALITDPPYSAIVHETMKTKGTLTNGVLRKVDPGFDHLSNFDFVPRFVALARRWSLFFCALEDFGRYQAADPACYVRSGIYAKGRAMPQITGDRPGNRCEGIAIFHPKGRKRWNGGGTAGLWVGHPESRKITGHPTAKPVLLCMRLIELFTDPGETVLDPFAGSGAIGLACVAMGRGYLGIEKSAEHVANARRRLAAFNPEAARSAYREYLTRYTGPGTGSTALVEHDAPEYPEVLEADPDAA